MIKRKTKIILEVVPGAIISLPTSLYFASTQVKYHPYWHSFIVGFLGFWILISAGIWSYFYAVAFRNAFRNREK
jgi:hypothetical protein